MYYFSRKTSTGWINKVVLKEDLGLFIFWADLCEEEWISIKKKNRNRKKGVSKINTFFE